MNYNITKARSLTVATTLFGSLVIGEANAALTITWSQIGTDVVATSSGSLEAPLIYLLDDAPTTTSSYVYSSGGYIGTQSTGFTDLWDGTYSGSFSAAYSMSNATLDSGIYVGLGTAVGGAIVDSSYTFGSSINSSSTWSSKTLIELDLTVDDLKTMTYNTATGTDSITLRVVNVPEPSSAFLLGLGGLSLAFRRPSRLVSKWR